MNCLDGSPVEDGERFPQPPVQKKGVRFEGLKIGEKIRQHLRFRTGAPLPDIFQERPDPLPDILRRSAGKRHHEDISGETPDKMTDR